MTKSAFFFQPSAEEIRGRDRRPARGAGLMPRASEPHLLVTK
jgi:hypothetical protein